MTDTVTDAITDKRGQLVVILTETEGGIVVGWDTCWVCKRRVSRCGCENGPAVPPYVQKWRYSESAPDCRNNVGARPGSPGSLEAANRGAAAVVERNARSAREHGDPQPAAVKPTPAQMADRIAKGLKDALLPEG